jgi:hypothetical protein
LTTEGAATTNDDNKPMTEDQATELKLSAKLQRRKYEPRLSKAEAGKCVEETKREREGD